MADVDDAVEAPPSGHPPRSRRFRIARIAAVSVVVLALLFYAGGGWYFSGQIHSTALKVKPSTISKNLRITSVTASSVSLDDEGKPDRGLHVNEVWGLVWDNGFGQLTGTPSVSGSTVTRAFTLLSGDAPKVGTLAGLTRDAFPDDPEVAIGRTVQQVTYASPLGAMSAWFVNGSSPVWAILVHGWTANRTEALRMMRTTVALGMPSLAITYRNDVSQPQDPSGLYQFGRTEWRDLDAAVEYATRHGARNVVLLGASMGGGIVASFMEHSSHTSAVRALVLDSPMLSFSRAVNIGAAQKKLPGLGLPLPHSLTWMAKKIAAERYDVDFTATDYLRNTGWGAVPTLLFHGDADTRVPISGSKVLAKKRPNDVTFVVVPGAGHVESWNADPGHYDQLLTQFLTAHLA